MDNEKVESKELTAATQPDAEMAAQTTSVSVWSDQAALDNAIRTAKILASSDLVPEGTYKSKPANCLIALDMANRMGMSPLNVMQNLYIVKGKPGWSGQFCIAAANASGRFTPMEFVRLTNDSGDTKGYYARATEIATGKICEGAPVTWDMVKAEGWFDKNGSKWKTMPELMFRYRAAAFFVRNFCPEVLNGLQTIEEIKDVNGYEEPSGKTTVITLEDK